LFPAAFGSGVAIFLDAGSYPIARWGAERAAGDGVPVYTFRHHDSSDLASHVRRAPRGRRPVVVVDGLCAGCGRKAPLAEYLVVARGGDGWLVLDDTQALGILGAGPRAAAPFGEGGGGSLAAQALRDPRLVVGASLAKGFGAPVAVLAADEPIVRRFRERSDTRVHCSPPSAAAIRAAEHAFAVNAARGDALRSRLADVVSAFREGLRRAGLCGTGEWFPVQTLELGDASLTRLFHRRLCASGVRTVLQRPACRAAPVATALLTIRHTAAEIARAAAAIDEGVRCLRPALRLPPRLLESQFT
jgi:8-amino-7-oxononanoate synthase